MPRYYFHVVLGPVFAHDPFGADLPPVIDVASARHRRQENGRKVLAVPAFIAARTMMFASSNSSGDRGETSAFAMHPEARNASWRSRNSRPKPRRPRRERPSNHASL